MTNQVGCRGHAEWSKYQFFQWLGKEQSYHRIRQNIRESFSSLLSDGWYPHLGALGLAGKLPVHSVEVKNLIQFPQYNCPEPFNMVSSPVPRRAQSLIGSLHIKPVRMSQMPPWHPK